MVLTFALFLLPCFAWGYRPFVSTDAAVVDPKDLEIEFGYFSLERTNGENTFITPQIILNIGIARNMEIVGEFEIENPPGMDIELVDPGLFLKAVLKEGLLQEKKGVSFAVEAGLLLPTTVQLENGFGFEALGILSKKFSTFMFHFNLGGGLDRAEDPFVVWGIIAELPINPKLTLVGEINGESIKGESADNSVLFGFIWDLPRPNISIDAGMRRGFSSEAPDWMFTTGLTFGFSLPSYRKWKH